MIKYLLKKIFSYKIILCFYNNNNHYSVFNRFKKHTLHKLILILLTVFKLLKYIIKSNKFIYRIFLPVYIYICTSPIYLFLLNAISVAGSRDLQLNAAIHLVLLKYHKGDASYRNGDYYEAMNEWKVSLNLQRKFAIKYFNPIAIKNITFLRSGYWSINIGHICLLQYLIKLKHLKLRDTENIILFCNENQNANHFLLNKFKTYIDFEVENSDRNSQIQYEFCEQKLNLIKYEGTPHFQ